MITESKKLVCVTDVNNNKFYDMDLMDNGDIKVVYGRVGYDGKEITYRSGQKSWNTLLNSKIKKGYKDISELKQVVKSSNGSTDIFKGIGDKVKTFLKFIMDSSRDKIKNNYLVTSNDVTMAQVEKAQELIDKTIPLLRVGKDKDELNAVLMQLYTVIPRKMKKVQLFLVDSLATKNDLDEARKLIDNEQSLLSTLESEITANIQNTSLTDDSSKNILEEMGVEVEIENDPTAIKKIQNFLGSNLQYVKNIYRVKNNATQKRYDDYLATISNKKTALLWHGSRNENWLGIIQKGLMIRPSNAIITGAMFGNGLYFANRSQKSVGYTSMRGSHWTGGTATKGFISLFSVHMGTSKDIHRHDSTCYRLHNEARIARWDSVFAHAGTSLRNDEIMVYKTEQATISYIIEMEK